MTLWLQLLGVCVVFVCGVLIASDLWTDIAEMRAMLRSRQSGAQRLSGGTVRRWLWQFNDWRARRRLARLRKKLCNRPYRRTFK